MPNSRGRSTRSVRPKIVYPCIGCSKNTENENSLCFDTCNRWCHATSKCCGLSDQVALAIVESEGKLIKYTCLECESKIPTTNPHKTSNISPDTVELKVSISKLFETVTQLSSLVRSLSGEVAELRGKLIDSAPRQQLDRGDIDSLAFRKLVGDEVRELHEREKRKDSIVIRGVPPNEIDSRFKVISKFLCPNLDIYLSDVIPLKSNLIRAKVLNFNHRRELLLNSKKLAGSQFSSIYISRDLTYRQRSELKSRRSRVAGGSDSQLSSTPVSLPTSLSPSASHVTNSSNGATALTGANSLPVSSQPAIPLNYSPPNSSVLSSSQPASTPGGTVRNIVQDFQNRNAV